MKKLSKIILFFIFVLMISYGTQVSAQEISSEMNLFREELSGIISHGQYPDFHETDKNSLSIANRIYAADENEDVEGLREALIDAIDTMESSIDIRGFHVSEATYDSLNLLRDILNSHPDYYYVKGAEFQCEGEILVSINILFDDSVTEEQRNALAVKKDSIIALIDNNWNDEQKVLFIHDYIVTHCQYDHSLSKYNVYNCLVEGTCTCSGYAQAMQYLMKYLGIECGIVSSRTLDHAWNVVRLSGKYYYLDCTWDDPSDDNERHSFRSYCRHSNCLMDENTAVLTGHNSNDWVITLGASQLGREDIDVGNSYDGNVYFRNLKRAVLMIGTKAYFTLDYDETGYGVSYAYCYDYSTNKTERISNGGEGVHPGIFADRGSLYTFDSKGIYYIQDGSAVQILEYMPEIEGQSILDAQVVDGRIRYYVYNDIYEESLYKVYEIELPKLPIHASSISFIENEIEILKGNSKKLITKILPRGYNGVLKWESDDASVVTVDANGNIVAAGIGTTMVRVICDDVSAVCRVHVINPLEKVILSDTSVTLYKGKPAVIKVRLDPEDTTDDKTIEWFCPDDHLVKLTPLNDGMECKVEMVDETYSGETELYVYCGMYIKTCQLILVGQDDEPDLSEEDKPEEVIKQKPEENNPEEFLFNDVTDKSKYYFIPVQWAVQNGVTSGTGYKTFSPDDSCTRGQIVTFLWRAAGSPEPSSVATPFTDLKPEAYYEKAVAWAVEKGITQGTTAITFGPNESCTRAQIVTFLWRSQGSPVTLLSNKFSDVPANAYYAQAVAWAGQKGITQGTSATQFSPASGCTRGQVVTFLYRSEN